MNAIDDFFEYAAATGAADVLHKEARIIGLGKDVVILNVASSIQLIVEQNLLTDKGFWIPIPQDRRRKGAFGPVLSNQVSFLFYKLFPEHLESMKVAVDSISEQMISQMRTGIPKSYNIMMDLSRRLPMWLCNRLMKAPTKGAMASFFFSDTGNSLDNFDSFLGYSVKDAIHYPPNAGYPGFTVVFMTFQQQLSVIIGYTKASADAKDIALFEETLRKDLMS